MKSIHIKVEILCKNCVSRQFYLLNRREEKKPGILHENIMLISINCECDKITIVQRGEENEYLTQNISFFIASKSR